MTTTKHLRGLLAENETTKTLRTGHFNATTKLSDALIKAAPALLDVVEAAEMYRDEQGRVGEIAAYHKLDDALTKLNGVKP